MSWALYALGGLGLMTLAILQRPPPLVVKAIVVTHGALATLILVAVVVIWHSASWDGSGWQFISILLLPALLMSSPLIVLRRPHLQSDAVDRPNGQDGHHALTLQGFALAVGVLHASIVILLLAVMALGKYHIGFWNGLAFLVAHPVGAAGLLMLATVRRPPIDAAILTAVCLVATVTAQGIYFYQEVMLGYMSLWVLPITLAVPFLAMLCGLALLRIPMDSALLHSAVAGTRGLKSLDAVEEDLSRRFAQPFRVSIRSTPEVTYSAPNGLEYLLHG